VIVASTSYGRAVQLRQATAPYMNNALPSPNITHTCHHSCTPVEIVDAYLDCSTDNHRFLRAHIQPSLVAVVAAPHPSQNRRPKACRRKEADSTIRLNGSAQSLYRSGTLGLCTVLSGVRIAEPLGRYPVARVCSGEPHSVSVTQRCTWPLLWSNLHTARRATCAAVSICSTPHLRCNGIIPLLHSLLSLHSYSLFSRFTADSERCSLETQLPSLSWTFPWNSGQWSTTNSSRTHATRRLRRALKNQTRLSAG